MATLRVSGTWRSPVSCWHWRAQVAPTSRPGELDGPRRLAAEFAEEFHVGDERSERQFVRVTSMAFGPNGQLVVTDRPQTLRPIDDFCSHLTQLVETL